MAKLLASAALLACVLCACQPKKIAVPVPERSWEGELRILPGDSSFMPCGTQRRLRITGPGLDSLAHRYAWLKTLPGQWIKSWCSGHLAAPVAAGTDSVLVAAAYAHMDATVHCRPLPVKEAAGSYVAEAAVPGGTHREQLNFFPDGSATVITSTPSMHAEVDGHWGLNSDGHVIFEELDKKFSFEYGHSPGQMARALPNGSKVVYRLQGPADRLAGDFGRTARWLAAVAAAQGDSLQPGELKPEMRLDSLFPDEAARAALRLSAADTLALDEHDLAALWPAAETIEDVVQLVRRHARTRQ